MKPSMRKLWAMLPRVLLVRIDVVGGQMVGIDALDGVTGKACGLDASYPGFGECLKRLIDAKLVIHAGDFEQGTPDKGRIERFFVSMRPTESKAVSS